MTLQNVEKHSTSVAALWPTLLNIYIYPTALDLLAGHELIVMSSPSLLSQLEYDQFNRYLCQVVMREP